MLYISLTLFLNLYYLCQDLHYKFGNDMGNCCLRKTQRKKIVLLLLGLDNAGKTVAAKNLVGEPIEEVIPTVGFSVIRFRYMKFNVEVFDLGGGSNIRGIWNQYFVDAHGIIFTVDSSDYLRLNEVKEVLHNILSHEKISGKPLLLLANKQDSENALDEMDIIESLELEYLVNNVKSPTLVESCSATAAFNKSNLNIGIKKGCNWLLNYIIREYEKLNVRVQDDIKQQQIITLQDREKVFKKLNVFKLGKYNIKDEDVIELYSDYCAKDKNSYAASVNLNTSCSSLPSISNNIEYNVVERRPKSATQMLKDHLLLEYKHRKVFINKMSNKTQPITLLGMQLTDTSHKKAFNDRRLLKSAGDNVRNPSHYSANSIYSDGQLFEMKKIPKS